MPFKSKAQQRWMYATHPKMAKKWSKHTKDADSLPDKVKEAPGTKLAHFFPDQLHGGKADGRDPSEFDPKELEKGARHEMEHTDDPAVAMEIAMDHLTEDPHYYSDLEAAGRLLGSEED
jgi:hypothetical protein